MPLRCAILVSYFAAAACTRCCRSAISGIVRSGCSAKALFGKIKGLLGLKSNANSPELKKELETALAAKPEAVAELQKIVPPAYWQNAGTVNMYVEKGSAIGQNSGTQTNNFN